MFARCAALPRRHLLRVVRGGAYRPTLPALPSASRPCALPVQPPVRRCATASVTATPPHIVMEESGTPRFLYPTTEDEYSRVKAWAATGNTRVHQTVLAVLGDGFAAELAAQGVCMLSDIVDSVEDAADSVDENWRTMSKSKKLFFRQVNPKTGDTWAVDLGKKGDRELKSMGGRTARKTNRRKLLLHPDPNPVATRCEGCGKTREQKWREFVGGRWVANLHYSKTCNGNSMFVPVDGSAYVSRKLLWQRWARDTTKAIKLGLVLPPAKEARIITPEGTFMLLLTEMLPADEVETAKLVLADTRAKLEQLELTWLQPTSPSQRAEVLAQAADESEDEKPAFESVDKSATGHQRVWERGDGF